MSKNLVAAYLAATGWTGAELAKRSDLSQSIITRIVHGRSPGEPYVIGELAALKLERATLTAFETGQTNVPPLRARDLRAKREAA